MYSYSFMFILIGFHQLSYIYNYSVDEICKYPIQLLYSTIFLIYIPLMKYPHPDVVLFETGTSERTPGGKTTVLTERLAWLVKDPLKKRLRFRFNDPGVNDYMMNIWYIYI